ncbi:MAG: VanW family protein [Chloroflexi bacterium]|nr:VanW family protein [Chloroflexota bacterium]
MGRHGGATGRVGRRRLLGLGVAATVGAAGALLPAADRYGSHLAAVATGADAADRLQAAAAAYLTGAQTLTLGDQAWTIDRQPLGLALALEPAAAVSGILPLGRAPVMLVASIDQEALTRALAGIPDLDRAPVDARLTLAGVVATVEPDRPGRRLDAPALADALVEQARLLNDAPVALPVLAVPATTTADALRDQAAWLNRILSRPLALVNTPEPRVLDAAAIAATLQVEPAGAVTLDRAAWANLLAPLAAAVKAEPGEPRLRLAGGRAEITPPQPGRVLDITATIDAAWAALLAEQPAVAPVLSPLPARTREADLVLAAAVAQRALTRPPVLVAGATTHALTTADVERLLRGDLSIDPAAADAIWQTLAPRIDSAPHLPLYRWRDGQALPEGDATPGRHLDRDAALAALTVGLREGETLISLPLQTIVPAPPTGLTFPDVLAEGRTYYGDSARERFTNVALGLQRIDGALVPPGGVFSFNQASGPVTYATGFQRGYGIAISNGQVTTLPSVGGGICQVATTMFHAAFRAGLPILDRSWHLYWMPRYGRAPSGMTGLDATVDDQVGLDFRFVNATDGWLLVEAGSEAGNAVVRLRGTDPGWQVAIQGPLITNVVRASQAMTERKDPSLRRGTRVWVEHAEDGKTVTISRSVLDEGGALRERRAFVSHYAPAANVTLVGTG